MNLKRKKIYVWRWFFLSICKKKKNTNTNKLKKGDFWTFSLWALTSRYSERCSDQAHTFYWYAVRKCTRAELRCMDDLTHTVTCTFAWHLIKEKSLKKISKWLFTICAGNYACACGLFGVLSVVSGLCGCAVPLIAIRW